MRLVQPFIRLPLDFDAAALRTEVEAVPEGAWRPHPDGTPGNSALPLVAVEGDPSSDATIGPMRPTPHLEHLPYARQVLAGLGTVIGRTRLMRVDRESEVVRHVDTNHYWWDRVRVHVPIVTHDSVAFECGDATTHLAAGETWIFDTWRRHRVVNPADHSRIHLVVDTVGSAGFWSMVEQATGDTPSPPRFVPNRLGAKLPITFEEVNAAPVMTPWEVDRKLDEIVAEARRAELSIGHLEATFARFRRVWRATWAAHGDDPVADDRYLRIRDELDRALLGDEGRHRLENGVDLVEVVRQLVLRPAVAPTARRPTEGAAPAARPASPTGVRSPTPITRPVIIVSPPRSGSTLLFETLSRAPELFTVGGESHRIIESIPELHPANRGWPSNRLTADDATVECYVHLHRNFLHNMRDRNGTRAARDGHPVRLLEKTPKNALRIPFLADVFPDATFVYLYRDPRETISSMLDAWRSGRFVTYPALPDWDGPPWSLLLTPGWRDLRGRSLAEIVVDQWCRTTTTILDDLDALGPDRWCVASYDRLVSDPAAEIGQLCEYLGLDWDVDLSGALPESRHTVDSPHPDKWRRNADELEAAWEPVREVARRAHDVFADPPRIKPVTPAGASADAGATNAERRRRAALARSRRSVHTPAVPELLRQLGASLLVSTYQSGHVIVVRHDGEGLNTHFRSFPSPMGMAIDRNLLALGTKTGVWVYQNQPSVTGRLQPPGKHDACFMPRTHHVTGDIRVHDLAFSNGELWIVNTRFSCLSTLDGVHSFVPRWRPGFVSALAPEDRCHLNGLALVDGDVRYVSALGTTDTAGGWREDKADGGVVIDVPTGEIVAAGLSMPHSPRWYRGKLWILESGHGSIATIDPETGDVETIAHLPGFTRGIAFAGKYAFIGLSQVREHLFGGLPLTEHLQERVCGVWVVDIEEGTIAGFLRFEGDVQEIYDVQLTAARFPEFVEPGADLTSDSFILSDDALAQLAPAGPTGTR